MFSEKGRLGQIFLSESRMVCHSPQAGLKPVIDMLYR